LNFQLGQAGTPVAPSNWYHGPGVPANHRFQWNFPLLFSPHDASPSGTLYTGANVLFKSTNEGQSWEIISPDLTRNDKSKQASSGGPITKDNTSIEYYDTIFTVMESPVAPGTIWTGSDDGLVYLTRDAGKSPSFPFYAGNGLPSGDLCVRRKQMHRIENLFPKRGPL